MPKRNHIFGALGITAGIVCAYLWLFGVQTGSALVTWYQCRRMPDVARTPVPLADLSISAVAHKRISYFGYEFELPWDDVDEQKDKTEGTIHVTYFHSGNAFWFSTFPPRDFVNEIMKEANLDPVRFRKLYGEEAFKSDYGFHKEMLQTTPSQVTPFVSRRQAVSGEMLLLFKATSMPRAHSGIFSIQTPEFQGFQFENPQNRPTRITDELYSNDGGIDLIFLQKVDGDSPTVSQSEINRVIESIHKLPVRTVSPNASGVK